MRFTSYIFVAFVFLGSFSWVCASHNLAAHFSYRALGGNAVEITLTTYTDPSAAFVDRCTVDFELWDSVGSQHLTDLVGVERVNGPLGVDPLYPANVQCPNNIHMGEYVIGTIKKNVYVTSYTFAGPGKYMVRFYDGARLNNILNMANSGIQAFYVEAMVTIDPGLGPQNSVVLLNHQLDFACTGQPWTFNPGGWDADGDSLDYRLAIPKRYDPPTIPSPIACSGYRPVDSISPNAPLTIDARTGFIRWESPQVLGVYCFAIQVREYRNGMLLDSLLLDQLVYVEPCTNRPPQIVATTDTTVLPGASLHLDFAAWDPDFPVDSLYFELDNAGIGLNSAFVASPGAVLTLLPAATLPVAGTDTVRGRIDWATDPSQARAAPYQIDLYAYDNVGYQGVPGMNRLSRHHVILVYLQAPLGVDAALVADEGLSLSPNPARDAVHVEVGEVGPYHVAVMDLTGRVVLTTTGSERGFDLDVSGLPNGIYSICVEGWDWARRGRLVRVRE